MTITQAIGSSSPPIGRLAQIVNNGDTMVKALIAHAITDLNKFLNFQNIMTVPQIAETTEMILSDYNALKIEDIRVCFSNGKKGHYGQLYGRLDGQIIMLWLSQYSTDRTNEYLRIKDFNEKQALNKKINPEEINVEGQKKVIEMMKDALKSVEVVKVEKPVREKTADEIRIQKWLRDFTKLSINKNYDDSYRFIFRYGKVINSAEYLQYKVKQYDRVMNFLSHRYPF